MPGSWIGVDGIQLGLEDLFGVNAVFRYCLARVSRFDLLYVGFKVRLASLESTYHCVES